MPILSRRGLLAIAAVVDIALQKDGRPVASKTLAKRHGLSPRHLEAVLQSLVHGGILKGIRGPRGGYELAIERNGVTVNDILRSAETATALDEPKSDLVVNVLLPVLAGVEHECGQALSRISLDEIVRRANGRLD
jgi:Rrf2 family transcriptional regulator, iron-sulfur cluster assembly transcription factor